VFVPWVPRYRESEARSAVADADCWADALAALGLTYHGKSINTLRKWCARWGIATEHLRTPQAQRHRYTEDAARQAIASSYSWAEALRKLGYCHSGANPKTLKKRAREWGISTEHFDRYAGLRSAARRRSPALEDVLVKGSTYSRAALKRRLYEAGLKTPECELCGQDENWHGRRMSMILDHINGVRDDNRIENLRIVCPNCAATLDTHCGRKNRVPRSARSCERCGRSFIPSSTSQRYCSRRCGSRYQRRERDRPPNRRDQPTLLDGAA
jgi:ribosomal protein S27AE